MSFQQFWDQYIFSPIEVRAKLVLLLVPVLKAKSVIVCRVPLLDM